MKTKMKSSRAARALRGSREGIINFQQALDSLPKKSREKVKKEMIQFGKVFGGLLDTLFGTGSPFQGKP